METGSSATGSLVFKRSLMSGKIWVRTECQPGSVTVLQDENGADLAAYEAFFYGKTTQERIIIEFDQKPADLAHACLIGFEDIMEPTISISDYLLANGYALDEIPNLFATYELDKVHYLPCAHLPQGPQRVVLLLAALRSERPALVLKDPFMPFSGRWREHFAKLLMQIARERNRVIVCTNLSFVPQTWGQSNLMQYLDVGHAADEGRAKYQWELDRKERELQEKQKKVSESVTVATPEVSVEPVEKKNSPKEVSSLPEPLKYIYREVQDHIFAPLKEISDFFRAYSAIVIVGCMALLIATMGIAFSPNLSDYREKMKNLGRDVEFSFSSLLGQQPVKPVEITAPLGEEKEQIIIDDAEVPGADELDDSLQFPDYSALLPEEMLSEINESQFVQYLLENGRVEGINCQTPIPQSSNSEIVGSPEAIPPAY